MIKRKKWSEAEERTLISKYSDLRAYGTLVKLKTREKKFKPIADHVNSVHHNQDPIVFPFKWSWRDVSIKIQNMRHQYIGVKQKIRMSEDEFNWKDGENHWENFLMYKHVFGDVELDSKWKGSSSENVVELFDNCGDGGVDDVFKLGFEMNCCEELEESDDDDGGGEGLINGAGHDYPSDPSGVLQMNTQKRSCGGFKMEDRRRIAFTGAHVSELRDLIVKREKRKEREWNAERGALDMEENKLGAAEWEERVEGRELELEERMVLRARVESEKRLRLEKDFDEERLRRMKFEERREDEEMEWREKMVGFQIEHEKQMMQMHAEACQNQMQILGVMARMVCQFIGSTNDGFGGGLGPLGPQALQDLEHSSGLGEAIKPDSNSPSDFL